jgi:hypothetical protein
MCTDLRKRGRFTRRRFTWLAMAAALLVGAALYQGESRAVEPVVDPAAGNAVQLIIRDGHGLEIRVFTHTDLREAGVPVINLDNYEMDQTVSY